MKKKFRNKYNPSIKGVVQKCYEPEIVHGQVLTTREIINRGLYGNIVDKVVNGAFMDSDFDSIDVDDMANQDIIEKSIMIDYLGELQSEKEISIKEKIKQKQLDAIEKERIAKEQFNKSVQDIIKKGIGKE